MKKHLKWLIPALSALLIIPIVVALCIYFRIDRTAERLPENGFLIDGERYRAISIAYASEGRTVAKADNIELNLIPEDKDRNFLVARSFLDDWAIVKESYEIPLSGEINVVYFMYDRERYEEGAAKDLAAYINKGGSEGDFTIMARHSEMQLTMIWVGYEDCPVGTDCIAYVARINGKLVWIEPEVPADQLDYQQQIPRYCHILPDEFADLLADEKNRSFHELVDR